MMKDYAEQNYISKQLKMMNDYANQSRNSVSGEPQQVLIVFDTKMSRKASRYFVAGDTEKKNILAELAARGAHYIIGDDTQGDKSVTSIHICIKTI